MGDGGRQLAFSRWRQFVEKHLSQLPSDRGKGAAIEEQEGSPPVASLQEVECFFEGEDGAALGFPLRFARSSSFRVKAMLRSTSFARSSVDADNRLPVPVFDKSGSGLKR
jgi:hypothetical protein